VATLFELFDPVSVSRDVTARFTGITGGQLLRIGIITGLRRKRCGYLAARVCRIARSPYLAARRETDTGESKTR
jgi:hypothetical protein